MSHQPPLPDAAVAPWPAHPAPLKHDEPSGGTVATAAPANDTDAIILGLIGSAVAIGGAALVAALLLRRPTGR